LGENNHYFIQIVFTEKEEENQYYSLSVGKINKDASVGKQFLTILFPRSIINPFKISFAGTETLDINSPNDINNNEKYRTDKLLFLNNLFEYFGLLRFSKTLFEKAIYNNPKDEHRFAMQRMKVQITNDVNHILTVFSKNDPTEFAEKLSLSNPENEFNTFMTDKNQYQKLLSPTQMDEKDYWGYVNVEGEAKGGRPRTSAKYNYKKIDKKVKLADGRERSVYVGAKNKQYVKLKGAYVALSGLKRND
jgi:hypothetical protein